VDKGTYNGRRVDFSRYATSCFTPYLFTGSARTRLGCGACALALLTGVRPEAIAARNGGPHYPDDFMVRFLRTRGFKVLRLTMCNLSARASKLGNAHVILISQLFRKNEGTWGVIHNGLFYHNFSSYNLETMAFLNQPILSAYLIVHPRWRFDLPEPATEKRIVKLGRKGIPFSLMSKALSP
jgi:hypothetical protein